MNGSTRRVAVTGMAAVAVAAGLLLGFFAVRDSAVVLPLTLEVLLLAGGTWLFVLRSGASREDDRWLSRVLLAALVLRIGLAIVVNFVFSGAMFAPDVAAYEYFGRRLASYWQGEAAAPGSVFESWQDGYYYVNGAFFYLFGGASPLGPVVLNVFVSLWTVVLAFRLGTMLVEERTARTLALLVAFFPSLVLWSVLNIRDAISTFLVTLAAYLVVKLARRIRGADFALLLLTLLALSLVRQYMVVLVGLGAVLGLVAVARKGRALETLFVGAAISAVVVFGAETLDLLERVPAESPFEAVAEVREQMMRGAASTFGEQLDPGTPTGALMALPVGLVYLLFAPFPWAVSSTLQMLTLPEVLLWYALVPFTVLGARRALGEASRYTLIPVAVLCVVLSTYALVEGNLGTAYRHRAQIMPFLFLFTAAGIEGWRIRRERRREEETRRRRRARERLRGGAR